MSDEKLTGPLQPFLPPDRGDSSGLVDLDHPLETFPHPGPSNGYIAGWMSQYTLKALLKKATAAGDVSGNGGGLEVAIKQLDSIETTGCCPIGLWWGPRPDRGAAEHGEQGGGRVPRRAGCGDSAVQRPHGSQVRVRIPLLLGVGGDPSPGRR